MDKSDVEVQLSGEIIRITSCAYPTSFKRLHDILRGDSDGLAFEKFARNNPCKIGVLVELLLDAISVQTFAVDLLTRLCTCRELSDRLLTAKPEFLDAILRKALGGRDEYTKLCITTLRNPLPDKIALPQAAEELFLWAIEATIREPSAERLTAVYDLISGACSHLPQVVLRSQWTSLETRLVKILKSGRNLQDQTLSLRCLGILRAFALLQNTEAAIFFGEGKGPSTVRLAVLQAAWITKSTNDFSYSDLNRSLGIIRDILETVDISILRQWGESSEGRAVMNKILSNVRDPVVDVDIALKLLSIAAVIMNAGGLSSHLDDELTYLFTDRHCLRSSANVFATAMDTIISQDTVLLYPKFWLLVLRHTTQECFHGTLSRGDIFNLNGLIQRLQRSIGRDAASANGLLAACEAIAGESQQSDWAMTQTESSPCSDTIDCPADRHTALTELYDSFKKFWLLVSALSTQAKSHKFVTATLALINSPSRAVAKLSDVCLPSRHREQTFALIDEPSSDRLPGKKSLRDLVADYTEQEATWRKQRLTQMVMNLCEDLEDRCLNAEKPWRDAEIRATRLESEYDHVAMQKQELDEQVLDLTTQLRSLDLQHADRERALVKESTALVQRVDQLESQLQDHQRLAKTQMEELKSRYRENEHQMSTALDEKDAKNGELQSKLKQTMDTQLQLDASLKENSIRIADLELESRTLRDQLSQQKNAAVMEQSIRQNLEQKLATAALENGAQLNNIKNLSQRLEILQQRHDKNQEQQEQAMSAKNAQFDQQRIEHETAVSVLQEKLASSRETAQTSIGKLQQEVQTAQAQLHELQDLLDAKEVELSQMYAMRQTLAAAIGHVPERKHGRRCVQYTSATSSPVSRRQSRRIAEKHTADGQAQIHAAEQSFDSASSQGCPAPKRSKPRQPFKVPVLRQPRASTMATPRSVSNRPALRDVSGARSNMSPLRRQMIGKAYKGMQEQEISKSSTVYDEAEDLEFGSEIFTSTPMVDAHSRRGLEEAEEETIDE